MEIQYSVFYSRKSVAKRFSIILIDFDFPSTHRAQLICIGRGSDSGVEDGDLSDVPGDTEQGQGRHQEVGLEVVEWTGVRAGVTALT